MAPRIISDWEAPRAPKNLIWKHEYNRKIGQIDLKISTDKPQTKFEGEITDLKSGKIIMDIFCDQDGWRTLVPDVTSDGKAYIKPGPKIPTFNNMEELAGFMVDQASKIEGEGKENQN